ncbi:outer membrane protein assembly factor BamB [Pseudaeromonas sharmana]|uniref:Outer membrane protein assembly factor BamB n=1 Tax=Pseudaeromonas sharmana TaxID=328412 RepID=A0ABV8CT58_9GAMM
MHNWLRGLGLTLIAGIALQGCSLFNSEEDVVKMAPVPQVDSQFKPEKLWSRSVGNGVGSYYSQLSPVVAGDLVYAASRDGVVAAFDKMSGDRKWKKDLADEPENSDKRSSRLSGGMTAYYGKLFVGSENGYVYALDQETGELLWRQSVPGEVLAAPVADSGKLVVATTSGKMVALDVEKGDIVWTTGDDQPRLTLRGQSTPVIASGGVIYGRADGRVAVVLLDSGLLANVSRVASPRGATELERMVDVDAQPVVVGDELFAVAYNGQLMARKLLSGEELWKRKYSAYQNIGVGASDLILTDARSHIYGIDRRNGSEEWANTQLSYRNVTAPVVFGNYVVVGDGEGYLYWLDNSSGRILSMQELDSDGLYVAPVADGDVLYVQTRSGDLVALKRP